MRALILPLLLVSQLLFSAGGGDAIPDHSLWSTLLGRYVDDAGQVNYTGFAADPQLDVYLQDLETTHPDETWTLHERMAFWINVYNAYTVKLITDNLPLKSINDIDKPWDQEIITIEGQTYSLNDVEHEILRPEFRDPRVHFAINCASISCPRLRNVAFTSANLTKELDAATREFINDDKYNKVTAEKVELSPIFDWFKDDFDLMGGIQNFFKQYSKVQIKDINKVTYKTYDWGLNGQ